jgi:hypothetical protein
MASAALPHVTTISAAALSRLVGALLVAAQGGRDGAAPSWSPDAAFVAAVHRRLQQLLAAEGGPRGAGAGASGLAKREGVYLLRALAEWPLPEGGLATLQALADVSVGGVVGSSAASARLAEALRAAGLGEHALARGEP